MIITDNYRATDDTSFYFSSYTHLMTFADVYKKSCHLIPQAVVSQKKKKENVVKNAEDIYNFRDKIIDKIKEASEEEFEKNCILIGCLKKW